jgi:hypothetical protein
MKWYMHYFLKGLVPAACARFCGKSIRRGGVPFGKESDDFLLEQGIGMVRTLGQAGFHFSGSTLLEMGAGRQPIMPIIMSFLNTETIYVADNQQLLNETMFRNAVQFLMERHVYIAEKLLIEPAWIRETLDNALYMPRDEMLRHFRIAIRAPDARGRLNIADEHIDLGFSFNALEHCGSGAIAAFFAECKRLLKSNGRMFHIIDTTDHWARIDRSITTANFLKFDEHDWRIFCLHPLYYQNRCRRTDYETLLDNAGFTTEVCISTVDPVALAALPAMGLAEKFRSTEKESLAAASLQVMCLKKRENVQERIVKNTVREFRRRQQKTSVYGPMSTFAGV